MATEKAVSRPLMKTLKPADLILVEANYQKGLQAHQQGALASAEQAYRQALLLDPNHSGSLHLLGVIAAQAGNFDDAVQLMTKALQVTPDDFALLNNLGNTLVKSGRHQEAVSRLEAARQLMPNSPQVHNNIGNAFNGLGDAERAIEAYNHAVELAAHYAEAYANKATTLAKLKRYDQALSAAEQATTIEPSLAIAHNAKGMALLGMGKLTEANQSFLAALGLKPNYPDALHNRGLVYQAAQRWADAEPLLKAAVKQDPANGDYQATLADNLLKAKKFVEALQCIEAAEENGVEIENTWYIRNSVNTSICNWARREQELQDLETNSVTIPTTPFHMLGVVDKPDLHRQVATTWAHSQYPKQKLNYLPIVDRRGVRNKIRLGYFSADYNDHATMQLMAEFFELHDKSRFELHAYSFGSVKHGLLRERVKRAFDEFKDVSEYSDKEIINLARADQIDIAIDLKGYTAEARPSIFIERLAPLQVNYLGYPGTFAHESMDYILADRWLVDPEEYHHYAEMIATLPRTYQVNDRKRIRPVDRLQRASQSIPDGVFVFCCFNNNYKINPPIFDRWMAVLKSTPNSILWLLEDNQAASKNLRANAVSKGIEPERIIFAPRVAPEQHLARISLADLFLDTHPYNAHTTASEALWMGVPVLTMRGRSFASRVASSLLHAVGLQDLIVEDLDAYEAKAIELACYGEKLRSYRNHLRTNIHTTELFDTPVLTRDIERAYRMMIENHDAGRKPAHLVVPAFD